MITNLFGEAEEPFLVMEGKFIEQILPHMNRHSASLDFLGAYKRVEYAIKVIIRTSIHSSSKLI